MKSAKIYEHEAFLCDQAAQDADIQRAKGATNASPSFWRRKAADARKMAEKIRAREAA